MIQKAPLARYEHYNPSTKESRRDAQRWGGGNIGSPGSGETIPYGESRGVKHKSPARREEESRWGDMDDS